jgi:hypothetical protein
MVITGSVRTGFHKVTILENVGILLSSCFLPFCLCRWFYFTIILCSLDSMSGIFALVHFYQVMLTDTFVFRVECWPFSTLHLISLSLILKNNCCWLYFPHISLLRYKLHKLKCTNFFSCSFKYLGCTILWLLVYSQCLQPLPLPNSRTLPSSKKGIPHPLAVTANSFLFPALGNHNSTFCFYGLCVCLLSFGVSHQGSSML